MFVFGKLGRMMQPNAHTQEQNKLHRKKQLLVQYVRALYIYFAYE